MNFFKLNKEVSETTDDIDVDDVLNTKNQLKNLGYYQTPDYGMTKISDRSMFNWIPAYAGMTIKGVWGDNEGRWSDNEGRWSDNEGRWNDNKGRWSDNEGRWSDNEGRWSDNEGRWNDNKGRWNNNEWWGD